MEVRYSSSNNGYTQYYQQAEPEVRLSVNILPDLEIHNQRKSLLGPLIAF